MIKHRKPLDSTMNPLHKFFSQLRNSLLFTLLIICNCQHLPGQSALQKISFDNSVEASHFDEQGDDYVFELLFSIDTEEGQLMELSKRKKEFYAFLDELKVNAKSKKVAKRTQRIYDEIHAKYLGKYVDNPVFSDIFLKAEYNCVTATSLYALSLDYLAIPFEIKETPTHVYLVLYPEGEKILFETTNPEVGTLQFKEKQIKAYKDHLLANKLISQSEADDEDFFNKHYLTDSIINLKQLIGIQYTNNAIKYAEEEAYEATIKQLEKAYHYYAKEEVKVWLNLYILLNLDGNKSLDLTGFCDYLAKFYHYNHEHEQINQGLLEVINIKVNQIQEGLKGNKKVLMFQDCLFEKLADDSLKASIQNITDLALADYYYKALEADTALYYLARLYNDGKKEYNRSIKVCLMDKFRVIKKPAVGLDSLAVYEEIFDFIKEDKDLMSYKAFCQLNLVYEAFEFDELAKGSKYLTLFQADFTPEDAVFIPEEMVQAAYGAAYSYYMRKTNFKRARELLKEGLSFFPSNVHLRRMLRNLDRGGY